MVGIALGVPFYSCGGAAIPFVEVLSDMGMNKGAVLAFLIAGPATKLGTLYIFKSLLGIKIFIFYLVITVIGCIPGRNDYYYLFTNSSIKRILMKKFKIRLTKSNFCFWLDTMVLVWDISQAGNYFISLYNSFKPASHYDSITSATAKVSIVRSDDPELANPTPITNAEIDYPTIEDMVRRAIQLSGGFEWLIQEGDMVLLKPNIVDPEPPGSGEVTDVRVIKALIKIIDEISPGNIEIVVGEGSPREMDYELAYSSRTSPRWEKLWDVAGYQDLLTDPYLDSINFRLSNLNGSPPESPWDDLILVDIPGGGEALPQKGTILHPQRCIKCRCFYNCTGYENSRSRNNCFAEKSNWNCPQYKIWIFKKFRCTTG